MKPGSMWLSLTDGPQWDMHTEQSVCHENEIWKLLLLSNSL